MIAARIARRFSRITLLACILATAAMYCFSLFHLPSHDQFFKGVSRGNSAVGVASCLLPLYHAVLAQRNPLDTKDVRRLSKVDDKHRVLTASPWCRKRRNNDAAIIFRDFNVPFLNERALRERYHGAPTDLHCRYRELLLPKNESKRQAPGIRQPDVVLGDSWKLVFGETLHSDFVRVSCRFLSIRKPLFVDYFAVPHRKEAKTSRAEEVHDDYFLDAEQDANSVLVITLGPTSSTELALGLPKTLSFLGSKLGAQQLLGYNRIGKDSLANQIPLIYGISTDGVERMVKGHAPLDDIPNLWSHFKRRNFITLFLEEIGVGRNSSLSTQDRRLGFRRPPADYYVRPFAAALNHPNNLSTFCNPLDHKKRAIFAYVRDVFRLNTDRKIFAYISLEGVSHSSGSRAAALDKALHEFLVDLHADGVFNKTFLFFSSDDGSSHKSWTQQPVMSEIQRYETNAPVCFVALPEWFARSYPEVIAAFEANRHRLVTPYDIHVTLLNLATHRPTEDVKTHKGSNLFRKLPVSRTCEDAFIPLEFCSCLEGEISTRAMWEEAETMARFSVDYINRLLRDDLRELCIRWELHELEEAKTLAGSTPSKILLRIVFTTTPESRFQVYGRAFITDTAQKRRVLDTVHKLDGPVGDCLSNTTAAVQRDFCACRQIRSSLKAY